MKILPLSSAQNNLVSKSNSKTTNLLERSPKVDTVSFGKKKANEAETLVPIYKTGEMAYDISYSKSSFLRGNFDMVSEDVELSISNGTLNGKRIIKGEAFDKQVGVILDSGILGASSGKISGTYGDKILELNYRQDNDRDIKLLGDVNGLNQKDITMLALLAYDKIKRDVQNENDLAVAIATS